jgi:hypothetical protein
MHPVERQSREILSSHRSLVQRIVAITSRRRRLSDDAARELSHYVVSEMSGPDTHGLGPYRGRSGLSSYLAVAVQRLYRALTGRAGSRHTPTPVEDAVRRSSSKLSSRDALVLKMWFESGMTTQKIARVLGMTPADVHGVIARQTGGVQQSLAASHPAHPTVDD